MELKERIKLLSEACGPAGFELEAAQVAQEMLEPLTDSVYRDSLGNVIGVRRSGVENAKRLLIDVHIDEVGFIITGCDEGFLRFATIGNIDPRLLPASEVKLLCEEPVYGVIGAMPPHVLKREDMKKAVPVDELYIDVGGREVPIGTPGVFSAEFVELAGENLSGKALDNRAGLAIVLDAMEKAGNAPVDMDLYILASVQEELGNRGARAGAFAIEPHQAIVVDVTFAHTPETKREKTLNFSGGAAIGTGPHTTRDMTSYIIDLAKEEGIPYQIEVMSGSSGTNAGVVQLSCEGVPTSIISLPLKYMHSPIEVISLEDANAVSELLRLYLEKPWKGVKGNA